MVSRKISPSDQTAIAQLRSLGFTSTRIGKVLSINPEIIDNYRDVSKRDPLTEAESLSLTNDIVLKLHDFVIDVLNNGSMTNKMRMASMIVPRMFANIGKNESATLTQMREELTALFDEVNANDSIGDKDAIS